MTPSLAQQTLAKLKALLPRWYAARESAGIDILHALRGEEGDDFGGLFAMVELLLASERERERLAKQVQNDSVTIVSLIEINAADGAKLASLERGSGDVVEALTSAAAWLDRWAVHVGFCRGGDCCECGLTAVRSEASLALPKDGKP